MIVFAHGLYVGQLTASEIALTMTSLYTVALILWES